MLNILAPLLSGHPYDTIRYVYVRCAQKKLTIWPA